MIILCDLYYWISVCCIEYSSPRTNTKANREINTARHEPIPSPIEKSTRIDIIIYNLNQF